MGIGECFGIVSVYQKPWVVVMTMRRGADRPLKRNERQIPRSLLVRADVFASLA
jgi:hypothetical protein